MSDDIFAYVFIPLIVLMDTVLIHYIWGKINFLEGCIEKLMDKTEREGE